MSDARRFGIRLVRGDEVAVLADLFARTVRELGPPTYTPAQVQAWSAWPEQEEAFRVWILEPDTWVAESEDGDVLGFTGLEEDGHITALYVAPERTRQGVGTALLRHVVAVAKRRQMPRLYAEAALYSRVVFERVGFTVLEEEQALYNGELFRRFKVGMELPQ